MDETLQLQVLHPRGDLLGVVREVGNRQGTPHGWPERVELSFWRLQWVALEVGFPEIRAFPFQRRILPAGKLTRILLLIHFKEK